MESYISNELLENTFLFCYKRIADKETARDFAQDILMNAMMAIKQGKKIDNFFAWYWQMANNKIVNYYRGNGKKQVTSFEDILFEPSYDDESVNEIISNEEQEQLSFALTRLANVHRDIIIRFYLKEQSIAQISAELNIPVGTVKGRLFDARKDLHIMIERMVKDKIGKRKANIIPILFTFYWMEDIPISVLNSNLRGQILNVTKNEKKSINQIADEIGASPIYIEDDIKALLKKDLLIEPTRGKYLSEVCIFPKKACDKVCNFRDKIFNELDIGKRYFDVLFALKDKMISYDFYGNDFNFDYLLWYFTSRASKVFSSVCIHYIITNYAKEIPDRKFRYHFTSGVTFETFRDYENVKNNEDPSGYAFTEYFNAKCGNFAVHDTTSEYKELSFFENYGNCNNRTTWINSENGQLFFELLENPSKELNIFEQEVAADFISKGIMCKTEKGIEVNVPVLSEEIVGKLVKNWYECFKNIGEEFAEKFYSKINECLLPYVRDDLMSPYYNFIVPKYLGLTCQLLDYGCKNKFLKTPVYNNNTYGMAVVRDQKTIIKE